MSTIVKQTWAVVGASNNPEKFGYKIVKALLDAGKTVYPVNPKATRILDQTAYRSLKDLPDEVEVINFVTKPDITKDIIAENTIALPKVFWFQPGSFTEEVTEEAKKHGFEVIDDKCVLVELGRS